jgi:hypothetical protein
MPYLFMPLGFKHPLYFDYLFKDVAAIRERSHRNSIPPHSHTDLHIISILDAWETIFQALSALTSTKSRIKAKFVVIKTSSTDDS